MSFLVIGIDVGGTKIAAGLLDLERTKPLSAPNPRGAGWNPDSVLSRRTIPTRAERGGRAVLDEVLRLARELAEEAASFEPVRAIGVGVCELVNRAGQLASDNCIKWLDQPVREELRAIAPMVLEADVRAAAFAEAWFGAGRPFRNFLYVTVGTGISCCLMLDGRPYLGSRGATGTMGSSPLSVPCEKCGAMNERTLEEIAAGPALVARFNAAGGHAHSGQDVLAAAARGDSRAQQIVKSAGDALESQVGLLVNTLDPEAVIVGGGLGLSEGPYWEHFIAATRRHIWSPEHRELPILRAATGADAGWIGAAAKAGQEFR